MLHDCARQSVLAKDHGVASRLPSKYGKLLLSPYGKRVWLV